MTEKFSEVPVEPDTVILFQLETKLGYYDILYEKWSWDQIFGESIIFVEADVINLDDEELEKLVRESPIVKGGKRLTVKRGTNGFTFVNFNFEDLSDGWIDRMPTIEEIKANMNRGLSENTIRYISESNKKEVRKAKKLHKGK
jgi:hypothetical protein